MAITVLLTRSKPDAQSEIRMWGIHCSIQNIPPANSISSDLRERGFGQYLHEEIKDQIQEGLFQVPALSEGDIGLFEPDGEKIRARREGKARASFLKQKPRDSAEYFASSVYQTEEHLSWCPTHPRHRLRRRLIR